MAMLDSLAVYLLGFMLHAQPITHGSPWAQAAEHDRYDAIAHDMAAVVLDPAEPPLYAGEAPRAETGLLLASIGSSESQFRADVEAGHCRANECDGGFAVGLTQIHPGQGIVLLPGSGYRYDRHGLHARDLLEDRKALLRVTLHMARDSFAQCGNLSAFTSGQRCPKHERKAEWREHQAASWFASHSPAGLP